MSDIKCIVKCAKGHKLKYTSPNSLINSNQDYLEGFSCNHCTESYDQTGSYHCNKCCYDLCSVCYTNRAEGNCAQGHQLKKYKSPDDGYGCDICEDTFDRGSTLHGCRICNWDLCSKCFSSATQNRSSNIKKTTKQKQLQTKRHSNTNNSQGFSNFGALGELLQIIDNHMLFMNAQETNVDEFIDNSGSADLLRAAKDKALETEKELMQEIMNISEINTFLNNIVLIENLFNSFYTAEFKQQQQAARDKYAANIAKYETQSKPQCDIGSFVELMFAGTNLHISSFKKWLAKLVTVCKQNDIDIIENSGAKGKNIERAFYKSFYVYAVAHGDDGYKQMTDVLRCSLVFANFEDIYQCFALIEELSAEDDNGGILRCKDRFNPSTMPFGYRDMLINIYCPGSKIVAEIQLHHELFYKRKKISHTMYKKARLFEEKEGNMAYKYADEHIRKVIGDKIYESEVKDDEEKEDKVEEEEDEDDIFEQHECEMSAEQLFEKWKLTKYTESFIDEEGYDEPNLWKDISMEELKNDYGFKAGHAKKFIHHVLELEKGRDRFEEIKKKRKKKKKAEKEEVLQVMQEVEVPQKGKLQALKQQGGSGHVLAQPQKLQKEGDITEPVPSQPQSQPGQTYMAPPQQQTQPQAQPQQAQYVQPQQNTQSQLQQQAHYAAGNVLPLGWSMLVTADGKPYYLNNNTKVTQWERPTNVDMAPLQQQHQTVVPQQYVVPQQQQQQQQYVVPPQQNVVPPLQNQMQPQHSQYSLQPQTTQNQLQPQHSQYSLKPQHSQNQIPQHTQNHSQNQIPLQHNQTQLQPQNQLQPQHSQYSLKPQNSQNIIQQQQYNPPLQQQYRLNPQNSQNPLPNNQYSQQQQQPLQQQRQHSPPQSNQSNQYNQQLQRQNSPPQPKQKFGVSPRSPPILQQQSNPYSNVMPQQPQQPPPPQTHLQYGSGSGSGQYQQTNEQLQQTLRIQQQHEQQKLLLLQQQQQHQHQQLLQQQQLQQQQQQQQTLRQQQQQMSGMMGGVGVLGGGGGMIGGMGGMMRGMGGNNNMNANTSMNSVNSVNSANSTNINTMINAKIMSSDLGMDPDVGNDTDTFHENLATEIAKEDDTNFNSAFNSLYGNQQPPKQKQQQQPKQQQQTSSPFGYDSTVMGGFGNIKM